MTEEEYCGSLLVEFRGSKRGVEVLSTNLRTSCERVLQAANLTGSDLVTEITCSDILPAATAEAHHEEADRAVPYYRDLEWLEQTLPRQEELLMFERLFDLLDLVSLQGKKIALKQFLTDWRERAEEAHAREAREADLKGGVSQ